MRYIVEDGPIVWPTRAVKRFCKDPLKRLCRNLRLLPGKEVKDMIAPPDGMRPRCRERFLAKPFDKLRINSAPSW